MTENGWQPIETALKDGSYVDLWVSWPDGSGYREADFFWNGKDFVKEFEGMYLLPGDKSCTVTHWMPLPAPPTDNKDQTP